MVLFKKICKVVASLSIGQQFSEIWHHEDFPVNMEYTVILDIRTLALYRVRYLGSGFEHLLSDVSGSDWMFVPPLIHVFI